MLIFNFPNILLPDLNTNEVASHGFVKYEIYPKDGLDENTIIENTANIFFDFNPAIVTNTTNNIMVSQYPLVIEQQDPLCFGDQNGSITVQQIAPEYLDFFYHWVNSMSIGNTLENLSDGSYELSITDQAGNVFNNTTITLTSPEDFSSINNLATGVNCFNDENGMITTDITGGTLPYTYTWSNNGDGPILENLAGGPYDLTLTDQNGCEEVYSFIVDEPSSPLLTTIASSPETNSNADGTATVTANGGIPGYTYLWDTDPIQTEMIATNLSAGTYFVTITDANNCQKVKSVVVDNLVAVSDSYNNPFYTSVFPNPFQERTTITISNLENVHEYEIQIVEGTGKKLQSYIPNSEGVVHLIRQDLVAGLYFYNLIDRKNGQVIEIGKLIIQ